MGPLTLATSFQRHGQRSAPEPLRRTFYLHYRCIGSKSHECRAVCFIFPISPALEDTPTYLRHATIPHKNNGLPILHALTTECILEINSPKTIKTHWDWIPISKTKRYSVCHPPSHLPTMTLSPLLFRTETLAVDADGDTDFIIERQVRLNHQAAIGRFLKCWPEDVLARKRDALYSATEPIFEENYLKTLTLLPLAQEWPAHFSNGRRWLATPHLEKIVITAPSEYPQISDALTSMQRKEILQFFSSELPEKNAERELRSTRVYLGDSSGFRDSYFQVEKSSIEMLAHSLGYADDDLEPLIHSTLVEKNWARVDRAAPDARGDMHVGVFSSFRPSHADTGAAWDLCGLLPIRRLGFDKAIDRNEHDPIITHFRRLDSGAQAIGIEQQENGTWSAHIYTEVCRHTKIQSISAVSAQAAKSKAFAIADLLIGL